MITVYIITKSGRGCQSGLFARFWGIDYSTQLHRDENKTMIRIRINPQGFNGLKFSHPKTLGSDPRGISLLSGETVFPTATWGCNRGGVGYGVDGLVLAPKGLILVGKNAMKLLLGMLFYSQDLIFEGQKLTPGRVFEAPMGKMKMNHQQTRVSRPYVSTFYKKEIPLDGSEIPRPSTWDVSQNRGK